MQRRAATRPQGVQTRQREACTQSTLCATETLPRAQNPICHLQTKWRRIPLEIQMAAVIVSWILKTDLIF